MGTELPARLLRMLSLLQGRREWSGRELAERLGVSGRTIRRDVERLRELGYPVDGTTGTAGGYRLVSGRNLPPLLLTDEEAVALAVALRTATRAAVAGIDEAALRALAKLEQVLPPRLRGRVAAVGAVTSGLVRDGGAAVDPELLAVLAAACRDHELVVFGYRKRSGDTGERRVEPYGLVSGFGNWYLVGYDVHRAGWRTFRLDRLSDPTPVRHRFDPRPLPAPDLATYLASVVTEAPYRYRARVVVAAPAEVVSRRVSTLPGKVTPTGAGSCQVVLSADRLELVVADLAALATLGAPLSVDASPEVRAGAAAAARLLDSVGTGA